MKTALLCLAASTIGSVAAQTPSNFTVNISEKLGVQYGAQSVDVDEKFDASEVGQQPNISSPSTSSTGHSIALLIDTDAGSGSPRTTFLHWLATNVTNPQDSSAGSLSVPEPPSGLMYLPPSPPAGDYAHRYVFLLFEQPDNFTVPASLQNGDTDFSVRLGFDLRSFLNGSGVAKGLSANYMLVSNSTAASTTLPGDGSTPPETTATPTASSSVSSSMQTATSSGVEGPRTVHTGTLVGLIAVVFGALLV